MTSFHSTRRPGESRDPIPLRAGKMLVPVFARTTSIVVDAQRYVFATPGTGDKRLDLSTLKVSFGSLVSIVPFN